MCLQRVPAHPLHEQNVYRNLDRPTYLGNSLQLKKHEIDFDIR